MSEYIEVCAIGDIPADRAHAVDLMGVGIALVRDGDAVYAIRDACSHADVALSEGEVSGCMLECWLHGSQFDLRTGEPSSPPAITAVPIYPTRVTERDGVLIVEVRTSPMSTDEIHAASTN